MESLRAPKFFLVFYTILGENWLVYESESLKDSICGFSVFLLSSVQCRVMDLEYRVGFCNFLETGYAEFSRLAPADMQSIRNSILKHIRIRGPNTTTQLLMKDENVMEELTRHLCTSKGTSTDEIVDRVIGLVKKFDRIDACKVTETADFQKDLSLDSLDRVELVMAFEQEFSIEIPDEQADKLTCCADVARYITSQVEEKKEEKL
ncbi:unnamed protein product [Citrullus colocynthis]|uniref:Acyl carrier protein n=1 Tax=Citrullus colocynthis TaxID=252529 RepID=A0ABP0XUA7_9ROSI